MRAAARLLASVRNGKFLEPGTPTGLTGLVTHPSPRSALLFHYNATLEKLKQIPESSVYRQSTEALTRHRLKIIEESKPAGWDDWIQRVQMQAADNPGVFRIVELSSGTHIRGPNVKELDPRDPNAAWDGERLPPFPEGVRTAAERRAWIRAMKGDVSYTPERAVSPVKVEPEPRFTEEAIAEIENKIGAGLIEEVIQVAEGEHQLVDAMIEAKVWEPLVEQAPEGQWSYHERLTHTSTQKP
ncbi:hypothetical protein DM02DRAFT_611483 [Periconia macrospinosa]|uniref:Uncharacterized protein n=1 Tax=Periconia macrospinosa TaxID=97972 RepID=A0A2V1E1K6_9PLEO|nr:hypothetical protein DM02DRAFT_611483 [Periconia macrospinosa]